MTKSTLKNRTVGTLLSALGFEKTRIAGGKRAIFYDNPLIQKLCLQYGVSEQSDDSDGNNQDTDNMSEQIPVDL